jgi:hypothetical protein
MGKIFHETMPADDPQDARISWSPEAFYADGGQRGKGGLYDPIGQTKGQSRTVSRVPDKDEPSMQDGNITDHAVATIERMANGTYGADVANGTRPFFLAIGLHKPHIPWVCPARFWDLCKCLRFPCLRQVLTPACPSSVSSASSSSSFHRPTRKRAASAAHHAPWSCSLGTRLADTRLLQHHRHAGLLREHERRPAHDRSLPA